MMRKYLLFRGFTLAFRCISFFWNNLLKWAAINLRIVNSAVIYQHTGCKSNEAKLPYLFCQLILMSGLTHLLNALEILLDVEISLNFPLVILGILFKTC